MARAKVILASTSPRRKQLLAKVIQKFEVLHSNFDESGLKIADPVKFAVTASLEKARAVAERHPASLVIGADTIVVLDGRIMGKPKDHRDAEKMLASLSGKTHQVITGVSIIRGSRSLSSHEITDVTFNDLSAKDIRDYVYGSQVLDKAGAYAIQEIGDRFVKSIKGDKDNVIGLPDHDGKEHAQAFSMMLRGPFDNGHQLIKCLYVVYVRGAECRRCGNP